MTNAEKYLKPDMKVSMWKDYNQTGQKCKSIWQWLDQEAKPTLTEDERAILRNIKSIHNVIGRNRDGNIQLMCKEPKIKDCIWHINLSCYNHLFQFIKERRRILY